MKVVMAPDVRPRLGPESLLTVPVRVPFPWFGSEKMPRKRLWNRTSSAIATVFTRFSRGVCAAFEFISYLELILVTVVWTWLELTCHDSLPSEVFAF